MNGWNIVEEWAATLPYDRFEDTRHDLAGYVGCSPDRASRLLQAHRLHPLDRVHTMERKSMGPNARWGRVSGSRVQSKRMTNRIVVENSARIIKEFILRAEPALQHNPQQLQRVDAYSICVGQQVQALLTLAQNTL